jgi:hypothetical protein
VVAENVLLARNSAEEGGALWVEGGNSASALRFNHVTIADNNQAPGAAQEAIIVRESFFDVTLNLANTLISGSDVAFDEAPFGTGAPDLQMQAVLVADDVTTPISGTIATGDTPLRGSAGYVDGAGGDYHLTESSDAVDQGVAGGPVFDLDGVARPLGAQSDIGAFEFVPLQKQEQTITFDPLPDRTLGDAPFTLSATASSGLAVSYASLTPAVCSVSAPGGAPAVTLLASGVCSIVASQDGDAMFNPAAPVARSFTVNPEGQPVQAKVYLPLIDQ